MPMYALADKQPRLGPGAWVAPTATLIGEVALGADAGIWFGAIARGDTIPITIGAGSNVQDNAVLHADPGFPLTIGVGVTVGHGAILHGCTIGDGTLIGMGATVLNGAVIGEGCLVGANALVTEGKVFAAGTLIAGVPARAIRDVTDEERARIAASAHGYAARARLYAGDLRRID